MISRHQGLKNTVIIPLPLNGEGIAMCKRILFQTLSLLIVVTLSAPQTQASIPQSSKQVKLPIATYFHVKNLAPQTRLHLILACIETAARKVTSWQGFNYYLQAYLHAMQTLKPVPVALTPDFDSEILRSNICKIALQNIINAIALNGSLCHHDEYLTNLLTVVNTIFNIFLVKATDEEFANLFEYLEKVCSPEQSAEALRVRNTKNFAKSQTLP